MNTIISVADLSFKYNNDEILKNINFEIEKGSFISILGPNGSGKTTLLKNICNLLEPYNGSIFIDNEDIKDIKYKELAKEMAVVHQNDDLDFDFSVYDIVAMGRYPYLKRFQKESSHDFDIIKKAMIDTEVWNLKDKNIKEISGGEAQRVMVARALTQQPEILILDEPISHLDIKHQIGILSLCKKLNKENNITILMTIHDINLAGKYSDHIILINNGKIESIDTPKNVLTEENIEKVYGVEVEIINMGSDKVPYIVPLAI